MTKTVLSKTVYRIDSIIPSVQVYITYSGTPTVKLSCNDGSTWETVTITNNFVVSHTFTMTGTALKYKIEAPAGTQVSKVKIFV